MKLLGKVGIVSAMTGISRIFGLVREIIMAHFFGTSTLQSAFVLAFRIPNLFRRLFGEGALGAAFMPVFAEIERTEGKERAQLFVARIFGLLVCVLGLLVAIGIIISYCVEGACEPTSRWSEAMPLLRIMLPYAVLICLTALISAILNVHDKFAVPALTPVILNLVWLVALVGICPFLPAEGYWRIGTVSWGILLAGIVQVLFQLPELKRAGYLLRFSFRGWFSSAYVRQVVLQMGPASLGLALTQINICVDGWLAFYGAPWAPSALEYADRIIYLPLGLFGTAFATVLLPTYSKQVAEGKMDELISTFERAVRNLVLIMAPIAIGLMLLAEPIVALIYQRGAFTTDSTIWTARAILAYAPGLLFFSINKAVAPIFYAQKDIKTPVKVAVWCLLGNFTCNLLSVLLLPVGWRHAGIAASTVLNAIVNLTILLIILHRRGLALHFGELGKSLALTGVATGVMGGGVFLGHLFLSPHLPLLISVPLLIGIGMALYFPAVALLAPTLFRELVEDLPFKRRLKRFLPKK